MLFSKYTGFCELRLGLRLGFSVWGNFKEHSFIEEEVVYLIDILLRGLREFWLGGTKDYKSSTKISSFENFCP